jgi:Secretion system C-terminal sorting domain
MMACIYSIHAQSPVNPAYLDINQVKAHITKNGCNFWDGTAMQNSGYEVPKGSNKRTIFSDALWVGGRDAAKNLRAAAQTFGVTSKDFWPGPLIPYGLPNQGTCPVNGDPYFINNNFKINKTTIDSFKLAFANGQIPTNYAIPNSISKWPGNYPFGTKYKCAPFYDYNGDSIYNPTLGDYPLIKGDQAIFVVFNDAGNTKTSSHTPTIGLEIRRMSYAFNAANLSPNLQVLDYTTFHEYEVINNGSSILDSTVISIYSDADIGGPNDDYLGCDVTNQVAYAYNGDSLDANSFGVLGYLSQTPIQAYKILNTTQADCIDNDGDGLVDEADEAQIREMNGFMYISNSASPNGQPTTGMEFYHYMNNRFKDGNRLVYGRNGIPFAGGPNLPTNYCYPSISDPTNIGTNGLVPSNNILGGWSENNNGTAIPNSPYDKTLIINGRISSISPGDKRYFSIALITTLNPSSIAFNNLLPIAQQDWSTVTNYYNTNLANLCSNVSSIKKNQSQQLNGLTTFPNPAQQDFYIKGFHENEKNISLKITDMNGKLIMQTKQNAIGESIKLDVSRFENGIYFIKVQGQTFKLIKAE